MDGARELAPFLVHGGRVEAARAVFGGDDWIDLSTGIAPWSWPVDTGQLGLDRLPEPAALAGLEAAAAAAFGVAEQERVVAVPGSDLALRLLADHLPARRPAVVTPGYSGHRKAWPGARPIAADAMTAACDADLIILASPANPECCTVDRAVVNTLAQRASVVVDEAFADPGPGIAPDANDRLVVLRSFGKFYGLPGLRLGFVVCGASLAARLRDRLGDWPVSSAAIGIGTAAYRDTAWRTAQRDRIAEAGERLDAVLTAAGIAIVGSVPLFRYVACRDAHAAFRRLAGNAILTRPFADRDDRLRIGLPRDEGAARRLADALKGIEK